MKRHLRARLVLAGAALSLLAVAQAMQAPANQPWRWYKGNLHTHTVHSDGDSSPDFVARWYKEHGYQFLVLTDHNYFTGPQGLNTVFAATERFLLIGGEEVTTRFEDKPVHVNALGLSRLVEPPTASSVIALLQADVDAIRAAGALPSLNHPNFGWAVTPAELSQITNLPLFEVYNGHPSVHNIGGGGSPGLESMWDTVLTAGRRMYGVAVDDAHHFQSIGAQYSNPGRGWVSVKASSLAQTDILAALEAGDFYASTGVDLEDVERSANRLRLKIRQRGNFRYTTEYIGANGKPLATSYDLDSEYNLAPGDAYARAVVTDSMGWKAWVQPVFR